MASVLAELGDLQLKVLEDQKEPSGASSTEVSLAHYSGEIVYCSEVV